MFAVIELKEINLGEQALLQRQWGENKLTLILEGAALPGVVMLNCRCSENHH